MKDLQKYLHYGTTVIGYSTTHSTSVEGTAHSEDSNLNTWPINVRSNFHIKHVRLSVMKMFTLIDHFKNLHLQWICETKRIKALKLWKQSYSRLMLWVWYFSLFLSNKLCGTTKTEFYGAYNMIIMQFMAVGLRRLKITGMISLPCFMWDDAR